jgi:thiamine-phosphate pyrophosphorylase
MPGSTRDPLASALRILLVTDPDLIGDRSWVDVCRSAIRGGVTAVQVRHPFASAPELAELTRRLIDALPVPVFVNDRLDVALAVGAAGVHLGVDDVPVALARRIAPEGFLIGASVGTTEEVEGGIGADYWGVGPLHDTTTKDAGPPLGFEGFGRIVAAARGTPCVGIGGVGPADVPGVVAAAGVGIAVVSGILAAEDPEAATASYVRAWPAS